MLDNSSGNFLNPPLIVSSPLSAHSTTNTPSKRELNLHKGRGPKILRPRFNAILVARLVASIYNDPQTIYDLVDDLGLAERTVRRFIEALKKEKLIYISSWTMGPVGRKKTPVYKWGEGEDKTYPRKSDKQKAADYRARKGKLNLSDAFFSKKQQTKLYTETELERTKRENFKLPSRAQEQS